MNFADDPRALAEFIRRNLPVRPVPGLPHIRLHTATASSGVWRLGGEGAPYWPWCWGGGLALAHHLAACPQEVRGRRVLDLGSGSGLVAIAAAMAGAGEVRAVDTDPRALAAIGLNAGLNGVAIAAVAGDLLSGPPPDADLILVGDLFYEPELARLVLAWLDLCRAAGLEVMVGDIGRADLPLARLAAVAAYPVHDFGQPPGVPGSIGTVYRMRA
ncbi:class I SAM-dependent methyltransferase [Pelagibacterium lacus]|uniref:class I SAM-dependent methyltransferase n=1 Tax=Pelagibacterium lacus TaxID=2282655 RepID=UPI001FE5CD24|nr:50S ribosomal protein L11 methyltransferase [Pelagibacterium lacus]